jgi:hypothetical protein
MHSVRAALSMPWELDIDASIKPLYGRQKSAEQAYEPGQGNPQRWTNDVVFDTTARQCVPAQGR